MPHPEYLPAFKPGDVVDIAFADFTGRLTFLDGGRAALKVSGGDTDGFADTFEYELSSIGERVFLLSWRESIGSVVVHAIDRAERRTQAFIASADGRFLRLPGEVRMVSALVA